MSARERDGQVSKETGTDLKGIPLAKSGKININDSNGSYLIQREYQNSSCLH